MQVKGVTEYRMNLNQKNKESEKIQLSKRGLVSNSDYLESHILIALQIVIWQIGVGISCFFLSSLKSAIFFTPLYSLTP